MPVGEICPVFAGRGGYDGLMPVENSRKLLLSVIELGGYPDFTSLYESLGYEVAVAPRMRKALGFIKQRPPDVIIAEFNFQSDFRDRTSSLESLLAGVQQLADTRVIVFYEREFTAQFDKLRTRMPVYKTLPFPIEESMLQKSLQEMAVADTT